MAAPRLKVGGLDLSTYLRLQPDESPAVDPAGMEYFKPQFSGAPALGEGSAWVGDAVENRTMVFPLYIDGANRAAILKTIREVDQALIKGAQVEFCIDPDVDQPSFFDLERGTFEQSFNVWHLINTIAGGVLTLYVRPYANTATHRLIASIPAATSAVVEFAATGIMGDAYALANLEVRVGSQVASAGRVVAWGVHPHPSHNPYRAATSGLAQTGATVRGASGAIGSQYTAIPVSPTGASGVAYTAYLDPPSAHVGRHRVMVFGRSGFANPIALYAKDRFGGILGPTALASQTDQTKWQMIDLGEINVPMRASGQDAVPTQFINLYGAALNEGTINASPGLHLNGIMFLPLDYSAGILRTPGAGGGSYLQDSFARFPVSEATSLLLDSMPIPDVGNPWSKVGILGAGGYFSVWNRFNYPELAAANSTGEVVNGATGFYNLASGALFSDVLLTIRRINVTPVCASGAWVEGWAKRRPAVSLASAGVWARLTMGPSLTMQLYAGDGTKATMLASAGIASSLATAVLNQTAVDMSIQCQGATAAVYLATGVAPSPILIAGHVAIGGQGNPALRMQQGAASQVTGVNAARNGLSLTRFSLGEIGAEKSDINARNFFRFESHPKDRIYQGNASVFEIDRLANYRGQMPKIPPVPTAATGPARLVVFQGEIDNVQGLDGPDISLEVLEQFRFLR